MPLHLDILDVGQGDGMVVWLPNGKVMMVDLGSTRWKGLVTEDSFEYLRENTPFKNPGVTLEWLVLTHGDTDHYNMVEEFLDTFQVNIRNVLHGGLRTEYGKLIGNLGKRKNSDGTLPTIQTGVHKGFFPLAPTEDLGAEVMVMAIGVQAAAGNYGYTKNTRSVVLRIAYKGIGLLLAGDATRDTEGQILGRMLALKKTVPSMATALRVNVLKVAHHGSHRTSNHAAFIAAVNPEYAFISSDRHGAIDPDQDNITGHKLPQALTISLLEMYAARLKEGCAEHSYVTAYLEDDYNKYNEKPEIPGQTVDLLPVDMSAGWLQINSTRGIFTTLTSIGEGDDADNEDAKDGGTQYRVTISDNGELDILSTDDYEMFDQISQVGN